MSVYLSFSLTPVQRFIAAARSVRDLALGSALLTELVGIALTAAQNEGGTPVFPAIRATELPDSIPNQFLVRFDSKVNAERAAERARAAVEACWTDYAQKVHDKLDKRWETMPLGLARDWDAGWTEQIETFWSIHTLIIDEEDATEQICEQLFGSAPEESLRRVWKLLGAGLEANKQVRRFSLPGARGREKCPLFAGFEQMGPATDQASMRTFWKEAQKRSLDGVIRLGKTDRLCAIGLVKRYLPLVAQGERWRAFRKAYPDTAEVATEHWRAEMSNIPGGNEALEALWREVEAEAQNEESTFDESWSRVLIDAEGTTGNLKDARSAVMRLARAAKLPSPPRYYTVHDLDGDNLGKRLSGDPEYLNPGEFNETFYELLSQPLQEFAGRVAPILQEHHGWKVYAGGDDALGLTPVRTALKAAGVLQAAFPSTLPGARKPVATVSAGIVVAHYQHHLRDVLQAARHANERAKHFGRNACAISVLKRSGGDLHTVLSWPLLGKLDVIATHFENKEPDGWVSRLAQALPGMSDKLGDIAPFGLLINHYLDHSQASDALKAQVKCFWQEYLTFLDERHLQLAHAEYPYKGLTQFPHYALTQFLDAMQIAMFFARGGRD